MLTYQTPIAMHRRDTICKDEDVVYEIEAKCFVLPQLKRYLYWSGRERPNYMLLAREDERIVGFAGIEYHSADEWREANQACVYHVGVDPEYQGRGIAAGMVDRLVGHAKRKYKNRDAHVVTLHVAASNARAIGVYERAGFVKAGYLKRYYNCKELNYEDAWLMIHNLAGTGVSYHVEMLQHFGPWYETGEKYQSTGGDRMAHDYYPEGVGGWQFCTFAGVTAEAANERSSGMRHWGFSESHRLVRSDGVVLKTCRYEAPYPPKETKYEASYLDEGIAVPA